MLARMEQAAKACPDCGSSMVPGYIEGYYLAWFEGQPSRWRGILRTMIGGLSIPRWSALGIGTTWPAVMDAERCPSCGWGVFRSPIA